jgi:hypothetical protein
VATFSISHFTRIFRLSPVCVCLMYSLLPWFDHLNNTSWRLQIFIALYINYRSFCYFPFLLSRILLSRLFSDTSCFPILVKNQFICLFWSLELEALENFVTNIMLVYIPCLCSAPHIFVNAVLVCYCLPYFDTATSLKILSGIFMLWHAQARFSYGM